MTPSPTLWKEIRREESNDELVSSRTNARRDLLGLHCQSRDGGRRNRSATTGGNAETGGQAAGPASPSRAGRGQASAARRPTWHRLQIDPQSSSEWLRRYSPRPRRSSGWQRPSRLSGWPWFPSLARLLTNKSARHARRPFTSAASWPHDIRNTSGVTPKSICIGPAWPDMANKNDGQSAAANAVGSTAGSGGAGWALSRSISWIVSGAVFRVALISRWRTEL